MVRKIERTELNMIIDDTQQFINGTYDYVNGYRHTPYDLLLGLFTFDASPQGFDYWWRRLEELEKGKGLSKTAKLYIQRMINAEKRREKK